jgi:hypothetical protein
MSMRQVMALYERQRLRYFMDVTQPGLHVPPKASELKWEWLPTNSPNLAETVFDEDGDPDMIRVASAFACLRVMRQTIQHELIHIRLGPSIQCDSGGRLPARWRAEVLRLAQLGAVKL